MEETVKSLGTTGLNNRSYCYALYLILKISRRASTCIMNESNFESDLFIESVEPVHKPERFVHECN